MISQYSSSLKGHREGLETAYRHLQGLYQLLHGPSDSPSIRRREKASFSSEDTVALKGTQVGWIGWLLTLPCLWEKLQLLP